MNENKSLVVIFIFIFSFTLLNTPCVYSQNYHIYNFNSDQDLPQPYIYTINQDTHGYMWIGTGNGLVRYDGYNFKTYTRSDSLADNFINCSFRDGQDMWFGHKNGDFTYYNDNTFIPYTIDSENKSMITDIEKDLENKVILSTYSNGLIILNNNKLIQTIATYDSSLISITSFKFINKTEILIGSENGLFVFDYDEANTLTFKAKITDIPEAKITDIIKVPEENSYLIACENEGIYKGTINKLGFQIVKLNLISNIEISGIQNLIIDSERNLWIATMGQGLLKFKFTQEDKLVCLKQINSENGKSTDYIKSIFEDREGIIWSGTYGAGLSKILKKHYSYTFFDENIVGGDVNTINIDSLSIWIGTNKGLFNINNKVNRIINLKNETNYLPNKIITTVFNSRENLWIGTKTNGIYKLNKHQKTIKSYDILYGNLENSITSLTGNETELWIGTLKGVCHIDKNDSINWYTINKGGLPNNNINKVILDKNGRVWIASSCNKLSVIENGIIKNICLSRENKLSIIKTLIQDSDGNIWLGTLGDGLFKLENNNIIHLTCSDGLYSDYCYSVIYDGKENIWIGHHGGISQININSLNVKAIKEKFEIQKDYDFNTNAIANDKNNSIYLGFNKGIIKINIYDKIKTTSPLVNVTRLKINDKDVEIKDKIYLSSGKYKLSIDFIGINFKEPLQTKYQYSLEGYDDSIEVTSDHHAVYQRLLPGEYIFRLQAKNGDGIVSSNSIKIEIVINPPFWKLPSFYVIMVFLIFLIVIWRINRQKRIIKLKNIILEETVKERTAEISNQKEQIEKQNELIKDTNKDITDSIIYASRIQKAIFPRKKMVKSIFPNSFVLNIPKDIVSGDFYWVLERNNKSIFIVADSTGHGVPGAFMSMLGIALLNHIVIEQQIIAPHDILTEMRLGIIRLLRQDIDSKNKDSIHMGMCSFDKKNMSIEYSGAFHSLIHVRKGKLETIDSVKRTLGFTLGDHIEFKLNKLPVQTGDCLYMFSDGFQDQFGGSQNKKFSKKRLLNLLTEVSSLPIIEQKQVLFKTFEEWKGSNQQTDDILIMGIQI
ncbi:MAG: SpoIIE family protein phosphatase [Bacteroidales bacterium]|nr:SpoIIE family protein phosphatase [Bacteroidales bacterium]